LAFTAAGAKALVLSYWDAEPSATKTLLERMFVLMDGDPNLSISGALAASMKELQQNGQYSPERWAPFVVIGDGTVTLPSR
jgi:CHAT domain-containing protein